MALKLSINVRLLAIPIIGTLGALFGIHAHRSATGQSPLFKDSSGSDWNKGAGGPAGGGPGGTGSPSNGVANTVCCDRFYGISPPSKGEQFTCNQPPIIEDFRGVFADSGTEVPPFVCPDRQPQPNTKWSSDKLYWPKFGRDAIELVFNTTMYRCV